MLKFYLIGAEKKNYTKVIAIFTLKQSNFLYVQDVNLREVNEHIRNTNI